MLYNTNSLKKEFHCNDKKYTCLCSPALVHTQLWISLDTEAELWIILTSYCLYQIEHSLFVCYYCRQKVLGRDALLLVCLQQNVWNTKDLTFWANIVDA